MSLNFKNLSEKLGFLRPLPTPILVLFPCSLSLVSRFNLFLPGTKLRGEGGKYRELGNKTSFSTLPTQVPVFQSVQVRTSCKCISVAPVCLHRVSTSALFLIFLALLFFGVSLLFLCTRGQRTFLCGSPVFTALS